MIFLTVVSWVVFVALTLTFLAIIVYENLLKTKQDQALQNLQDMLIQMETGRRVTRTYWNPRMYAMVALWVASGAFIFW